jgi:thioredoxin 1
MTEISNLSDFNDVVLSKRESVLVDFYASWCGPCRAISPLLDEISEENPELRVIKINVEDFEEIAKEYGIVSLPTLLMFKNGQLTSRQTGFATKFEIEAFIAA